jgi:putative membrane protein
VVTSRDPGDDPVVTERSGQPPDQPPDQPLDRPPDQDFQRVHPLSPLLRVGVLVTIGLVASWRQLVEGLEPLAALLTMTAVVVFGTGYGVLSWWFTRFRIGADELRIDSGVLLRRSRRIRIERLQGVDVVQPLFARLFGMAELRFEVAGGTSTEAPLAFLRLDEAHRLRGVLLDRDQPDTQAPGHAPIQPPGQPLGHARSPTGPHGAPPVGSPPAQPGPARLQGPAPEYEIARVDPSWLILSTLLSTEFIVSVTFALLAIVASLLSREVASLALVLSAVVGVGSVLARGIIGNWGFVLSDTGRGWRLRSGLFDLRSQTVPLDRVQGIALVEPLLWRRMGWVRVQVDVAGYFGTSGRGPSPSTLLPVAPRPIALAVLARLVPGGPPTEVPQRPVPPSARWFRPVGWRYLGAGTAGEVVVTTRGWLKRRTDIVPHRKTQSIRVRQGPLQRRLGLVDVRFQTTPGPVDAVAMHRHTGELREWVTGQLRRAASH